MAREPQRYAASNLCGVEQVHERVIGQSQNPNGRRPHGRQDRAGDRRTRGRQCHPQYCMDAVLGATPTPAIYPVLRTMDVIK